MKSNGVTEKENNAVEDSNYKNEQDIFIELRYPLCKKTVDARQQTKEPKSNLLNLESKLKEENNTLNVIHRCTMCTKKDGGDKRKNSKKKLFFALSKNTEHSKSSVVNSCPGCGKMFSNHLDPLSSWRRSFSLPDIDTRPRFHGDDKTGPNWQHICTSGNAADKRSKEDYEHTPSILLTEELGQLLTPINTLGERIHTAL